MQWTPTLSGILIWLDAGMREWYRHLEVIKQLQQVPQIEILPRRQPWTMFAIINAIKANPIVATVSGAVAAEFETIRINA